MSVANAVDFCSWLSSKTGKTIRLPKTDEWEYAARGGKKSAGYEFSGSNAVDEVAWYNSNSGSKTHEVAAKKPNELGIYDMSGNVWEWCGTTGALRGGSWDSSDGYCRVSSRYNLNPLTYSDDFGFRVLLKK